MGDNQDVWPAGQTATMNVTYTQANAAGGAVVCEITPGAGNEFELLAVRAICSGTNGVAVRLETAAGGTQWGIWGAVASVAQASHYGPIYGTISAGAMSSNQVGYPMKPIVSGTQALWIAQTGAGAQNDTFQVFVNIRVKTGQMPTVTHANSTNPANVTATAGAESFTTV